MVQFVFLYCENDEFKKKTFSLAWGANEFGGPEESAGFDAEDGFDSFLAMRAPPEVRFTKINSK